jgi:hypothetical protein
MFREKKQVRLSFVEPLEPTNPPRWILSGEMAGWIRMVGHFSDSFSANNNGFPGGSRVATHRPRPVPSLDVTPVGRPKWESQPDLSRPHTEAFGSFIVLNVLD